MGEPHWSRAHEAVVRAFGAGTDDLSPRLRRVLGLLWQEWRATDRQIGKLTEEVEAVCREGEACRRLAGIPGIGPTAVIALAAAVAGGSAHAQTRNLSAWLGLVPQQRPTGGKTRLGGIPKRQRLPAQAPDRWGAVGAAHPRNRKIFAGVSLEDLNAALAAALSETLRARR